MNIYLLKERIQGYDREMYHHWIDNSIISFHVSELGAHNKMQEVLTARKELVQWSINESTDDDDIAYFKGQLDMLNRNIVVLSRGNNATDQHEYDLFFIVEQDLRD